MLLFVVHENKNNTFWLGNFFSTFKGISHTGVSFFLLTELSISYTWAMLEDSQCRELLLQAFRQRCIFDRKVLSDDTREISGHCQALEQMARWGRKRKGAVKWDHLLYNNVTFWNWKISAVLCVAGKQRWKCCLRISLPAAVMVTTSTPKLQ